MAGTAALRAADTFNGVNRAAHTILWPLIRAFWGFHIEGAENIPRDGRLIIAFNHVHFMDTILAAISIQKVRYPRFVGKEELFRSAIPRWFLLNVGVEPLDRSRGDVGAIRWALERVLEKEGCLVVFPEGTRSRTGKPLRPKPGVGFLAHQSGAPVLPARVWNTERWPALVDMGVRFGKPVRYSGDGSRAQCQEFADGLLKTIYEM